MSFDPAWNKLPKSWARTHGYSRTPTYRTWSAMRKRCLTITDMEYSAYGGRGISICESWTRFENFLADMGEKPLGKSLDRIDNNGNYEPMNCRWATPRQQSNNTRWNKYIEFNGQRKTISAWSLELGIPTQTISERLRHGYATAAVLSTRSFRGLRGLSRVAK